MAWKYNKETRQVINILTGNPGKNPKIYYLVMMWLPTPWDSETKCFVSGVVDNRSYLVPLAKNYYHQWHDPKRGRQIKFYWLHAEINARSTISLHPSWVACHMKPLRIFSKDPFLKYDKMCAEIKYDRALEQLYKCFKD